MSLAWRILKLVKGTERWSVSSTVWGRTFVFSRGWSTGWAHHCSGVVSLLRLAFWYQIAHLNAFLSDVFLHLCLRLGFLSWFLYFCTGFLLHVFQLIGVVCLPGVTWTVTM